jgi:hypothetical protein
VTLLYLTESEKLAWDLYYSLMYSLMITREILPPFVDGDETNDGIEYAAKIADKMIEQRRLRYMPRAEK